MLLVDRVPTSWFVLWLAIFFVLLALFFYCILKTNILRDPVIDPDIPETVGTFSLARTQAAWWFFFILSSYLFIGIVTGDFFTSLNGTALTLLGIGAGTAVLGSAIDTTSAPKDASDRSTGLITKRQELADTEEKIKEAVKNHKEVVLNYESANKEFVAIKNAKSPDKLEIDQKNAEIDQKKVDQDNKKSVLDALISKKSAIDSQIKKLKGRSERFFRDIVSDANGASFPRFQMIAWTIVLTVVFIRGVYTELAMPQFDTTLLGLMGLSAATYLGMKVNEPAAPTK